MTDYNKLMKDEIKKNCGGKKTILLHSCCAPCSSSVIEILSSFFDITVFYYNPNILPKQEYETRMEEQKKYLQKLNIPFIEGEYNPLDFAFAIRGKENLPEKSERCKCCYEFRIRKTAELAAAKNFDFFTTTLSVSPHKNCEWINEIMQNMEEEYKVKHLPCDFKKEGGFLRSIELSKENLFYRQTYCGCRSN